MTPSRAINDAPNVTLDAMRTALRLATADGADAVSITDVDTDGAVHVLFAHDTDPDGRGGWADNGAWIRPDGSDTTAEA